MWWIVNYTDEGMMGEKENTTGLLDTLPSNFVDGPHGKNQFSSSL